MRDLPSNYSVLIYDFEYYQTNYLNFDCFAFYINGIRIPSFNLIFAAAKRTI